MTYDELIATKLKTVTPAGFDVPIEDLNPNLYEWQKLIVRWGLRLGKAAFFEDCGLGKTFQFLEWAKQVSKRHGPGLIVCPLGVAMQTIAEGAKFGYEVHSMRETLKLQGLINIINYDRIEEIDTSEFAWVVLDESSILKNFNGKTRRLLTDKFKDTPYKLCCTATPAPNDFTELGQHAEFLNVCSSMQMLATWFINDTFDTGDWRLKKHSVNDFWKWVSDWAACISKPSDLGFSDEGYDLPPVDVRLITVKVDHTADKESGMLLRIADTSATGIHAENRRSLDKRVEAAAQVVNASDDYFIVWCETNDESDALTKAIPDSVTVHGALPAHIKEQRLNDFSTGKVKRIITKGSIAGMGMNWQHCCQEIYVGLGYSWEKHYQASRRIHRFGQKRPCKRYIVNTDLDSNVLTVLQRKQEQFETMKELMIFSAESILGSANKTPAVNTKINAEFGTNWTVYHGDCVRVLDTHVKSESIGFSVFSPPFADLFTYSNDMQDMGNCTDLDQFMVQFGYLIQELHRAMMPGRHVAVHCLDLLSQKWKDGAIELRDFSGAIVRAFREKGFLFTSRITIWKDPVVEMQRTKAHGLLYKTLCKDSADSRVGNPEYLLVFRKRGENPVPITHSKHDFPLDRWQEIASPVWTTIDQGNVLNGRGASDTDDEKYICPLQLDVIQRALLLWSAPDDLVLSPFTGIGSEGVVSLKMGRRFIGAELKESYWETACANLRAEENQLTLL